MDNTNNLRFDVMLDIETLGTSSDCSIIQICAKTFGYGHIPGESEWNFTFSPKDFIHAPCDIAKCSDLRVSGATLKWWATQNPEQFTKVLTEGHGSEEELLKDFYEWLNCRVSVKTELYVWSMSPSFDGVIVKNAMARYGLNCPISYSNDRDVRTIVELAAMKLGITVKEYRNLYGIPSGTAHDASSDVDVQIQLVEKAFDILYK